MLRNFTGKRFILLAFVSVFVLNGFAQEFATAPNSRAFDESQTGKIDKVFAEWDKPDSPGCALAVVRDGRIIYKRGYGMANLENGVPMTSKSVFDIASTSKQFTAMAILLLAQQGKLSLDDDARKYVPELSKLNTPITIRQLIYHTNGLRDDYYLLELAGWRWDDEIKEEDVLWLVSRQKELNHQPGAEFSYNNMGYSLLALIVKRAGGQSLREFAERNIFKPLGMNDTQFRDDHSLVVKNRTASYDPRNGGGFSLSLGAVDNVGPNGVFTTVEDFALWNQNFYEKKVGGEAGIKQMLKPGTLNDGTLINYAFGLRVENYKGFQLIWHSGAGPANRTTYLLFPELNFSVILFCNLSSMNMDALARQVADIYLSDQSEQIQETTGNMAEQQSKTVKVSERDLAEVSGLYFSETYGLTRRLYVKDGKLYFSRNVGNENELLPLAPNRFLMLGVPNKAEILVRRAQNGQPRRMLLSFDGNKPSVFESVKPAAYTAAQLAEFTGSYYSEELDATYTLIRQNGSLILQRRKWRDISLTAVSADVFKDDYLGVIKFIRNPPKRVTGFALSNGARGVRRIRFLRQP